MVREMYKIEKKKRYFIWVGGGYYFQGQSVLSLFEHIKVNCLILLPKNISQGTNGIES